ncbi:UV DNA damage repair endonuclease UvsE [Trichococcus pasteurii]|uniref:Uv-endonuclease uvde n=1 Tax=Trichococcus pasteurii TaxID=43064 RepID=A0A1W1IJP0_9LACT|nr:UV DNA damage repair endonuclease UvsE [Trichococcus pasteurii]SFF03687.1 UV-damage endonuclease [Trichococcus pasteurii]SLM53236.1 uv-endonuclease uvde [Trichococcus pasteurii]SSB94117.1 uv-endonuclease uvde [Trichococcus pasteurii]
MSIGYACLNIGTPNTNIRSVMQRNATPEKLTEVTAHNLEALEKMVDYNIANDISLYRISSDLIPFGSSPVNTLDWPEIHKEDFERIGAKIRNSGMRVSLHPGQYTVLNSPTEDVVERAIINLVYHDKILAVLGSDTTNKIVLHVGGIYGDKEAALNRFAENFQSLPEAVQNRLIIENDDRLYNIEDVLGLADRLHIPAVYDNLHHAINPPPSGGSDPYWIAEAKKTWKEVDGNQKIHYSQQAAGKRPGAHTDTIQLETFLKFYDQLTDPTIDIMLEVKDKNLSAIKCQNATTAAPKLLLLEKEWGRYKYAILEKSPAIYQSIRTLLKDKEAYPIREFYYLIDTAFAEEIRPGYAENAAAHVWGYFKKHVTDAERRQYEKNLASYRNGTGTLAILKRQLFRLAEKYEAGYLLQSLYFYL